MGTMKKVISQMLHENEEMYNHLMKMRIPEAPPAPSLKTSAKRRPKARPSGTAVDNCCRQRLKSCSGLITRGSIGVLFNKSIQLRERRKEMERRRSTIASATDLSHESSCTQESSDIESLPILDALMIRMSQQFPAGA
jgi:hypothetical protein